MSHSLLRISLVTCAFALVSSCAAKNVPVEVAVNAPAAPEEAPALTEVPEPVPEAAEPAAAPEEPAAEAPSIAEEPATPEVPAAPEAPVVSEAPAAPAPAAKPAAKPAVAKPAPAAPPPAAPAVQVAAPSKKTERLWKAKCGSCHGVDGRGATVKGREMALSDMTSAKWQAARTDAKLLAAIRDGITVQRNGAAQVMDGYGGELSAEELNALVQYTRWVAAPK